MDKHAGVGLLSENTSGSAVSVEAVLQELEKLAREKPELAEGCAYYQKLLPILIQAQAGVAPLPMDKDRPRQKIELGEPLLLGEDFDPPAAQSLPLFLKITAVVTGNPRGAPTLEQNALLNLIGGALRGELACERSLAAALGVDSAVLHTIVRDCLKPFFYVWQSQLMATLSLSSWQSGRCPFCGSPPALAELRGPQRPRRLRCVQCGADWGYNRLQCTACGNTDAHLLGLLQPQGNGGRLSVQTCGACQTYLKSMVTTEAIPANLLAVEDLASLSLDLIATRHGFHRPNRDIPDEPARPSNLVGRNF